MDLTMQPARGNSIQAYGANGFRINGVDYASGVLVSESLVAPLAPTQLAAQALPILRPCWKPRPRLRCSLSVPARARCRCLPNCARLCARALSAPM